MKIVSFFKTERDKAIFRVHFVKLGKHNLKALLVSRPPPYFPEKLVGPNMQDLTVMKCNITLKKLEKSRVR